MQAGIPIEGTRRWRNKGLIREHDVHRKRSLWRTLLAIVAACAPLAVYLLLQNDYVHLRYRIERLRAEHDRLVETERRLRVERATLQSLGRVEVRAERDLGLVRPAPNQLVVIREAAPARAGLMARAPDAPTSSR
jgi:cell division protein FtsL